jgi:hypothetical protein
MLWAALLLSPPPDDTPPSNDDALRGLAIWALQFTPRVAVWAMSRSLLNGWWGRLLVDDATRLCVRLLRAQSEPGDPMR